MAERETDHAWDALVSVTGVNPTTARGELNYALGQIRAQTEHMDISGPELALMIKHRAKLYRDLMPEMPLTPPALAKWWDRVEAEVERVEQLAVEREKEDPRRQRKAQNSRATNDCTTCGGDAWVVVGYRLPMKTIWHDEHGIKPRLHPNDKGHEETAPCPVCNLEPPVMRNFWDGRSWEYGSEPGEVVIP